MNTVEKFFFWVVQASWQAAVLALLILLVQFLFRNRLAPAWRYGLWLLLVARLLMPATPKSPVSIFNLAQRAEPAAMARVVELPSVPPVTLAPKPARTARTMEAPRVRVQDASAQPVPVTRTEWNIPWSQWALLGWLLGVAYFGSRLFWTTLRFRSRLATASRVQDETASAEFESCKEALGVRQPVRLVETDQVVSPAVCGLWRKRLLLPQGLVRRFSPAELRHIFLHEFAHIKRADLEINWIVAILRVVHWFNPVLAYAFARMKADREVATDALVLARVQRNENVGYGETILRLVESLPTSRRVPSLVGVVEDKKDIETRIRMIAGFGERKHWTLIAICLLGALAIFVCTDVRTRAADELGQRDAGSRATKLIAELKEKSRWTFGPSAVLFGDEDGELSAGFVRSIQIRPRALDASELAELGAASARGIPAPAPEAPHVQWDCGASLTSTDGRTLLSPGTTIPGTQPQLDFVEQEIDGERTRALSFSAGTCFTLPNPFLGAEPGGVLNYTVVMDVMFPEFTSGWAALWQTDPSNRSDAEWLISQRKGLGITDNYGGRVSEGEWHRLALVMRGSDARMISYIDGVDVQRKELDVRDEFYNRRRDDDVTSWTAVLAELQSLRDPASETALRNFTLRLKNGGDRARERRLVRPLPFTRPAETFARFVAPSEASGLTTAELIGELTAKSRWTLGSKGLLFADENQENAGGSINALQLRNYALSDNEVADLGSAAPELPRASRVGGARFAQWDFNGNLDSSTGDEPLVPQACGPAEEIDYGFAPMESTGSTAPEVARFGRGTCFLVPTGSLLDSEHARLLNFSVVIDVKFNQRPVGWVSLWQNDPANRTDADWFINKKQELGIRDFYGGFIADGLWHRLAYVVDGRNGTISHYVNGKKVRTKRMIMEDDYNRRGGAEPRLDTIIACIAELQRRPEPEAADIVEVFSRRMHNRPDPEAAYPSAPLLVKVTEKNSGKPMPGARVYYQMGASNEDFFPEATSTDRDGNARIAVPIPVAGMIYLTARAPACAPESIAVPGSRVLDDSKLELSLQLRQSITIGGTLQAEEAPTPFAFRQLTVIADSRPGATRPVPDWFDIVTTDEKGAWTCDSVPIDAQLVQLRTERGIYVIQRSEPLFDQLIAGDALIYLAPQ